MNTEQHASTVINILTYIGMESVSDFIETMVCLAGALITGFGISEVIGYIVEFRISRTKCLSGLKEKMKEYLRFTSKIIARHAKLVNRIDLIDEEIRKCSKTQSVAASKLRQIQDFQSRYVRTVGESIKTNKCYRALVKNTYVTNHVSEGKSHPILDDSWAKAQIVEVWSPSKADAVVEIKKDYQQGQGFVIDKIEEV